MTTIAPRADATLNPRPRGRTVTVVGDVYRFLATGKDTGGRYAQFEALIPPGGGPPPHVHHREEEGFYILEGEITLTIDGREFRAGPGSSANLPVGVPHMFRNNTDKPARMIVTVAPAGFEEFFFEIGTPVAEGTATAPPPTPDEIARIVAAAPRYGIEFLPPPAGK